MRAAREHGIDFLDDARYNDETGAAPIATGYSEVVFGDLFRAAGWRREETLVANKLWWEFWPRESAAHELDGSLARMGFDYVDLIYATPPPASLPVGDAVAAIAGLLSAGKTRAWGVSTGLQRRSWRRSAPPSSMGCHPVRRAIALQPRLPSLGRERSDARGAERERRRRRGVVHALALEIDPAIVQRVSAATAVA